MIISAGSAFQIITSESVKHLALTAFILSQNRIGLCLFMHGMPLISQGASEAADSAN